MEKMSQDVKNVNARYVKCNNKNDEMNKMKQNRKMFVCEVIWLKILVYNDV